MSIKRWVDTSLPLIDLDVVSVFTVTGNKKKYTRLKPQDCHGNLNKQEALSMERYNHNSVIMRWTNSANMLCMIQQETSIAHPGLAGQRKNKKILKEPPYQTLIHRFYNLKL